MPLRYARIADYDYDVLMIQDAAIDSFHALMALRHYADARAMLFSPEDDIDADAADYALPLMLPLIKIRHDAFAPLILRAIDAVLCHADADAIIAAC